MAFETRYAVHEALLAYAQSDRGNWPLRRERPVLTALNTWVALRDGDLEALKRVRPEDKRRSYRIDPLPDRIADAWAHYLAGNDPRIRTVAETDQPLMETMLGRDFPSELERALAICGSEGEIWGRVSADEAIAPYPMLDWVSRTNVLPLWQGVRLAAAAAITELPRLTGDTELTVYRQFEVHAPGAVVNALFKGTDDRAASGKLGERVAHNAHPATADLPEVWAHELPFGLLERIPNRIRRDRRIGVSDYAGILDYLLDLNEVAAIGAHNMRLTARKRAIISAAVAQSVAARDVEVINSGDGDLSNANGRNVPLATFGLDEEILVEDELDKELGKGADPFRILEYSFDAQALIAWKRDLVESALTRVGLTPQYVGVNAGQSDGYAISGTALRLRLIPTDSTGRGKGRYVDDGAPRLLRAMQAVDRLDRGRGGFGRPWTSPLELPTFERDTGIPVDEVELAQTHSTLVAGGLLSLETSLRERYPAWTDEQITTELDRIRADRAAQPAMLGGF